MLRGLFFCCPGAIALMQLQEDMKKQLSEGGQYTDEELEGFLQSHKTLMIDSLWKLNVADIENTLSRVCQMVVLLVVCQYGHSPLYLWFVYSSRMGPYIDIFRYSKILM